MSEETTSQDFNDGTWSGLKKTLIGTVTTLIAGGGTWLGVMLFQGGHSEEKEDAKTEQVAPAQAAPVINLNVDNSSQNNSSNGGSTTIIKEKVVEKPAKAAKAEEKKVEKKSESTDAPW